MFCIVTALLLSKRAPLCRDTGPIAVLAALPSTDTDGALINTLYLTIIIKTYIPFSSRPIKSGDHIFPTPVSHQDSFVTLRFDLRNFNDGAPLIS